MKFKREISCSLFLKEGIIVGIGIVLRSCSLRFFVWFRVVGYIFSF